MESFDWSALVVALIAVPAAVVAGLDLDRRRRLRARLGMEADLLAKMPDGPAASELRRSIDKRVLRLCAEEEPYTASEQRLRNVGVFVIAALLVLRGLIVPPGEPVPRWLSVPSLSALAVVVALLTWTLWRRYQRREKILRSVE